MRFARIFITMLAVVTFILSTTSTTTFAAVDDGGYIEVRGWGMGPSNRNPKSSFYKLYARQAVWMDALRRAAEMAQELTIDKETIVQTGMFDNIISSEFSFKIKGAELIKDMWENEEGYHVMIRVPIYGVTASK